MKIPDKSQCKKNVQKYFDKNIDKYGFLAEFEGWTNQSLFLKEHIQGGRFLDIGCGNAKLCSIVLKQTPIEDYVGVDISKGVLLKVKYNLSKIQADAGSLPFKSDSFEVVHAFRLMHHLIATSRKESKSMVMNALDEMCRVTSKDGYVIISDLFYDGRLIPRLAPYMIFYMLRYLPNSILKSLDKIAEENLEVCFYTSKEWRKMIKNHAQKIIMQWQTHWDKSKLLLRNILIYDYGHIHFIFKPK